MGVCDEWGGAESHGNGARLVECLGNERHLLHSPVSSPTEEIGRIQKRSDDSEGRERTRPGFYFVFGFCLCAAVAREGLSRCFMVILVIKVLFGCSLVPASFFP